MSLLNTPSENKKLVVAVVVAAILLVGGGFAAGRHSKPAQVVTTERVVTTVDQTSILNAIADLKQQVSQLQTIAQQQKVHVVRVTEKDPNGVTKTTVTTDKDTDTQAQTKTDTQTAAQVTEQAKTDTQTKQDETKTVTVTNSVRPKWSLGVQGGLNFAQMLGSGQPYSLLPTSNPYLHYAVFGVSVDHRFIGPVNLGAWANTNGAGGLELRLDIK